MINKIKESEPAKLLLWSIGTIIFSGIAIVTSNSLSRPDIILVYIAVTFGIYKFVYMVINDRCSVESSWVRHLGSVAIAGVVSGPIVAIGYLIYWPLSLVFT